MTRHSVLILISLANKKKGLSQFIFPVHLSSTFRKKKKKKKKKQKLLFCTTKKKKKKKKKKNRKISCSAPHTEKVAIKLALRYSKDTSIKLKYLRHTAYFLKSDMQLHLKAAQTFLKTRRIKYLFLETNIFNPSVVKLFL